MTEAERQQVIDALREAFDAWRADYSPHGMFNEGMAWAAWQAATLAERERAAKVCDALHLDWVNGDEHAMFSAASEIRKG